jgi:hypothetical protein
VLVVIELIRSKTDSWIVRKLLGAADIGWVLATFLVVPVLAVEGTTPFQTLRRSTDLFRKTWGQTITAEIGLGALESAIWVIVGVIPGLAAVWLAFGGTASLVGFIWIFASLIPIKLIGSITASLFRMTLYVYATEGVIPEEYKDDNCAWFIAPGSGKT